MTTPSLKPLLAPASIAIVGASNKPGSLGYDAVEMTVRGGFRGDIYPVNPRYDSILGLPCHRDHAGIGKPVDLVLICVAAKRVEDQVEAAISAGARALIVTANAIIEGEQAPLLADRLRARCEQAGIPLCGHNTMGFYNNDIDLRACGFAAPDEGVRGNITLISQSGSVFSTLAHNDPQLTFNLAITTGCETVTSAEEYMLYALEQPSTRVVGLYLETIRKPCLFIRALQKAADNRIPVVALKVGRSDLGARFALSHSGGLAGDDDALQAVFDRYGVIRTKTLDEMANTLLLVTRYPTVPAGGLVAIADSGGERNLLADEADHVGIGFARLSDASMEKLAALQDFGQEAANPLDPWGTGIDFERVFGESMATMLGDDNAAIGLFSQDLRDGYFLTEGCLEAVDIARNTSSKPLAFLTNFSGTRRARTTATLSEKGVPVLSGTREGLHALKNLLEFRDFSYRPGNPAGADLRIDASMTDGEVLQEHGALALLAQAGIPTVTSCLINNRAELEQAEAGFEYPLVLKTAVAGILHKTDAGGVVLDIANKQALYAAYSDMSTRLGARALVQPMVNKDRELLLGMKTDATFGPLVIVGAGGTLAEYFRDRAMLLPDAPEAEIIEKIRRLKIHRVLQGVRGARSVDLDALAAAVSSFARFCGAVSGSISEIDINPLHVGPDGVLALDALIIPHGQNG
jgi:acyl-CoA synthetase (NDP forming)